MLKDLYKDFAERYDLFQGKFNEHNPLKKNFFDDLFAQHNVSNVLDCACGTGKDLHLFHTLGYNAVGADISESMLNQARKNRKEFNFNTLLYNCDYRHLPQFFDEKFDAVVCLGSSILHMHTDANVICALESMKAVLVPNGILVLMQGTTDKQWEEKPRFIPVLNNEEISRVFVIDYHGEGATYNVLDITHTKKDKKLIVWGMDYPKMFLFDDYQQLLREAGFLHVKFYGSFQFDKYDKASSDRLIIVARNHS